MLNDNVDSFAPGGKSPYIRYALHHAEPTLVTNQDEMAPTSEYHDLERTSGGGNMVKNAVWVGKSKTHDPTLPLLFRSAP